MYIITTNKMFRNDVPTETDRIYSDIAFLHHDVLGDRAEGSIT